MLPEFLLKRGIKIAQKRNRSVWAGVEKEPHIHTLGGDTKVPSMGGPALTRYHVASLAVLNYNYLIFSSQNVVYASKTAVLWSICPLVPQVPGNHFTFIFLVGTTSPLPKLRETHAYLLQSADPNALLGGD